MGTSEQMKLEMPNKWSDVKPKGFYVYTHRRVSDGSVFYVGKGFRARAWDIKSRSDLWKRVASKHGVYVYIEKDSMDDNCAITIERILIAKYRTFGNTLSNMSDGGEGKAGYKSPNRKKLYTSESEEFETCGQAESFLRKNGYPTASRGNISSAARGKQGFAYGRRWSHVSFPERPEIFTQKEAAARNFSDALSKPVISKEYGEFCSIMDAVRFLSSSGWPMARSSNISQVCKGRRKIAYGSGWSYL